MKSSKFASEKIKQFSIITVNSGPEQQNGPRATPACALPALFPAPQAATWAWAGNSATRPRPPGPRRWPNQLAPLDPIERLRGVFGRMKNADAGFHPKTLSHFLFCSLSLSSPVCALSSFLSAAAAVIERASGRNNGAASPGAVAGPLAGVRVPQRVSAPPSSSLAVVPLWPNPGQQCPRPALSFPHTPACTTAR